MHPPDRILSVLNPPSGGWARLLARRDSSPKATLPWLPLVSGSLTAAVLMVFLMGRQEIKMQFNGARLMGERSQGVALRMSKEWHTTALPSDDPNVELYWVEKRSTPKDAAAIQPPHADN